jgi:hypothetical protein
LKTAILVVLIVLLAIVPAMAIDPAIGQWSNAVASNATDNPRVVGVMSSDQHARFSIPWEVSAFQMARSERMTVVVNGDLEWLEGALMSALMAEAPRHGIRVYEGNICPGSIVIEVSSKTITGGESRSSSSSSSSGYSSSGRNYGYSDSHSNSGSDGSERTGVYQSLKVVAYRMCSDGSREILASPGRISASDSSMVGANSSQSRSNSYSDSWSGRKSGGSRSSYQSDSSSSSWQRDEELDQAMMQDGLASRLAHQCIARVFQAFREVPGLTVGYSEREPQPVRVVATQRVEVVSAAQPMAPKKLSLSVEVVPPTR